MSEVLGFIHARGAWSLLGLIVIVAVIAIVLPCLGGCSDKDDAK
jgi:hypothetical protein